MISAAAFRHNTRKRSAYICAFKMTIAEIDKAIARLGGETVDNEKEEQVRIRALVPEEYHEFLPLFTEAVHNVLPPHRIYDHSIPLKEGSQPPFGPLYSLSRNELIAVREWLDKNLRRGWIRNSSSPAGAPMLFVKKADGSLRLCVDYRGLNEITIKDRYPLPLIRETLAQLSKAKYFTKLDIKDAYYLLRMAEGEEWKTAFRTRYGLFESLVMPMGLTNAPATFQKFINDILRPFLDQFCTAYLDDILIYSDTLEEHKIHVRRVLEAIKGAGLTLKAEKCEFHQSSVKFLGVIISRDGVKMDPRKVKDIVA
jgi:hypothetical protein